MRTFNHLRYWLVTLLLGGLLSLPLSLMAQDSGLPTFSGKGSVTQAIDTVTGAIFDLGGGITMTFPKGLPVGHSRLITLKKASKKPSAAQIQKGFSAVGTALDISVPLNAPDAPIVLSQTVKSDPIKSHQRLVLAMEVGTLCTDENKAFKLKGGLCSGWELIDANYDAADKRVSAQLHSTGGMRMVFGTVPND